MKRHTSSWQIKKKRINNVFHILYGRYTEKASIAEKTMNGRRL